MPASLMDPVVPQTHMTTFFKISVNRLTFQRKLFVYILSLNSRKHARIMVGAQLEQKKQTKTYCKGTVRPDVLPTLAVW